MADQDAEKILVMDKDGDYSFSLAGKLGDLGYETDIAGSCEEAREALRKCDYSVVIACSELPDWGGPQSLAGLKTRRRRPPAMLVAFEQERKDGAMKSLSKGAYDYLPRHCDPSRLEVTLERALTERALAMKTLRCKRAAMGLLASIPCWIGLGMLLAFATA